MQFGDRWVGSEVFWHPTKKVVRTKRKEANRYTQHCQWEKLCRWLFRLDACGPFQRYQTSQDPESILSRWSKRRCFCGGSQGTLHTQGGGALHNCISCEMGGQLCTLSFIWSRHPNSRCEQLPALYSWWWSCLQCWRWKLLGHPGWNGPIQDDQTHDRHLDNRHYRLTIATDHANIGRREQKLRWKACLTSEIRFPSDIDKDR